MKRGLCFRSACWDRALRWKSMQTCSNRRSDYQAGDLLRSTWGIGMERTLYAAGYLGATVASVALTPIMVGLARRWGVVDLPNLRKVHSQPTPRLGGLAIALAMVSVVVVALFAARLMADRKIAVVGFVALFVLVVGVFDDLLN